MLYTIGYATKPIETFIAQLQQYNIDVVADIRSVPYSKVFTEYHKENIAQVLRQHRIRYVYLGDELGPRSKDDSHYDGTGQVQFDRLMTSELFQQGLTRLNVGLEKSFCIALMCAEKDPATCHRSLLVGHYLLRHPLPLGLHPSSSLMHIRHDGQLENQEQLEDRITEMHLSGHGCGDDLFIENNEHQKLAYEEQLKQTSYRKP